MRTAKKCLLKPRRGVIKPRNDNQGLYVANILHHDITFGIGPAGTGKTYLAVAAACRCLRAPKKFAVYYLPPSGRSRRKTRFLPGDLSQKVDPYLRHSLRRAI
ncbi:PhoH family protein [Pseudoalteromonas sp. Hal099]